MKKINSTLALLLLCIFCSAQKEHAMIININAHKNDYPTFDQKFEKHFGFPSIEYQRRKGKRMLSLELARISFNKSPGHLANTYPKVLVFTDKNIQALGRVQFQRMVYDSSKRFQPFWGASFTPAYVNTNRTVNQSSTFSKSLTYIGVSHHFSVGSYYNFGRYFVQANALIGIGSVGVQTQKDENPALTRQQQQISIFDFSILNQDHLFRMGIGMKL